jgi:hypothetical protein
MPKGTWNGLPDCHAIAIGGTTRRASPSGNPCLDVRRISHASRPAIIGGRSWPKKPRPGRALSLTGTRDNRHLDEYVVRLFRGQRRPPNNHGGSFIALSLFFRHCQKEMGDAGRSDLVGSGLAPLKSNRLTATVSLHRQFCPDESTHSDTLGGPAVEALGALEVGDRRMEGSEATSRHATSSVPRASPFDAATKRQRQRQRQRQ